MYININYCDCLKNMFEMSKSALLCCLQCPASNSCRAIWMIKNTTSAPSDTPFFPCCSCIPETKSSYITNVRLGAKTHESNSQPGSAHVRLVKTACLKMQKGSAGSRWASATTKALNTWTAERADASLTLSVLRNSETRRRKSTMCQFVLLVNKRNGRHLQRKPLSLDAGAKLRTRLLRRFHPVTVRISWAPPVAYVPGSQG